MKSIELGGKTYTWAELRRPEVQQQVRPIVEKLIAEYRQNPARLQALGYTDADLPHAILYTGGKYNNYTEAQLQAEVAPETLGESMDAKDLKELQELYTSPEYKRASQLAKVDSKKLMGDPDRHAERRAWNRAAELEAAMKAEQPRRQDRDDRGNIRSPGGVMKGTDKYISTTVRELAKLAPLEQANRARELIAQIRNDPKHPYNDEHHLQHGQAVHEMQMLYSGQYLESGDPVIADEQ